MLCGIGRVWVGAAFLGVLAVSLASSRAPQERSIREMADSAARAGDYSTAVGLFQSAVSAGPDAAWAHRGLADCFRVNGAGAKAANEYEAVTKIDPNDADAKQLASLSRLALAEQQEGVVKAETFSAMRKFPMS